jgi:hypothetical protein
MGHFYKLHMLQSDISYVYVQYVVFLRICDPIQADRSYLSIHRVMEVQFGAMRWYIVQRIIIRANERKVSVIAIFEALTE